ncbi:MAG: hypothetical protein ACR2HE_04445 [Casimicrobiaceae bacterium]
MTTKGDQREAAIAYVADAFGVDDSRVRKMFHARRDAVESFLRRVVILGRGRNPKE